MTNSNHSKHNYTFLGQLVNFFHTTMQAISCFSGRLIWTFIYAQLACSSTRSKTFVTSRNWLVQVGFRSVVSFISSHDLHPAAVTKICIFCKWKLTRMWGSSWTRKCRKHLANTRWSQWLAVFTCFSWHHRWPSLYRHSPVSHSKLYLLIKEDNNRFNNFHLG